MSKVYKTSVVAGVGCELRVGNYADVLGDVKVDCVITDPPFSKRIHSGQAAKRFGHCSVKDIPYACFSEKDVARAVDFLSSRVRGWWVVMTDTILARAWEKELYHFGLYVFSPLPFVDVGSRVRLSGDGPASWTTQIVVARPRTKEFQKWGALKGAYIIEKGQSAERRSKWVVGGKPLVIMEQLVRDYSRKGDVVLDPFAGGGTTLLAAINCGRSAIGSEIDVERAELAFSRVRGTAQAGLF